MKNYLNVGCGTKYHKEWTNIDMLSSSPFVMRHNLLLGIPFNDNSFEVVYHSQVLEHFPKEKAFDFIKECYRVLKRNGIIRIVVPDLENIVDEYKRFLSECRTNPNKISETNYDWIILEMYDQTVRNYTGGQMGKFLKQEKLVNEQYLIQRGMCNINRLIPQNLFFKTKKIFNDTDKVTGLIAFVQRVIGYTKRKIVKGKKKLVLSVLGQKYRIGDFRLGGEVHQWMYDSYSLGRMLKDVGFRDIKIKNSYESDIPDWSTFNLDVKDGIPYAPCALFMEAKK